MRRLPAVFVMSAVVVLAGCATMANQDKQKSRDATLENYAAALRWSGFVGAYSFVDPQVRAAHPLDAAAKRHYNAVQVAEYEAQPPMATGDNTIEQVAHLNLIVSSSQSAYDIVDHQRWRYDPVAKRWWLESGLPDITPKTQ